MRDLAGMGVENESEGWGVETSGGDGSEMGYVTKRGKNQRSISVPTSSRTSWIGEQHE